MFNSQYYTCEQVDERLLQGYVDDFNEVNSTNYSKEDLLLKLLQAINWDQVFGKYEESPEFVRVYLDVTKKVLWGIRTNGDIYYGAGVPSQIIDYIDGKIRELHLYKVDDILIFLDDLLDSDKTLKELLEELDIKKVDKEEGKSLIDANFASGITYIESPEFKEVKLDADDKILEAIYNDGTKLFPVGFSIDGVLCKTLHHPEFLAAWLDGSNHLIMALKKDGDILFGIGVPSQIKQLIEDIEQLIEDIEGRIGHYYDNDEFIDVLLDSVDKILEGHKKNGNKYFGTPVENDAAEIRSESNNEFINVMTDNNGRIIKGVRKDGITCFPGGIDTDLIKLLAYKKWHGKKIVCFGDSITEYAEYVRALEYFFDTPIYNRGNSGRSVALGGQTHSFCERVTYPANNDLVSHSGGLPSYADLIILEGGTNDWALLKNQELGDIKSPITTDISAPRESNTLYTFAGAYMFVLAKLKEKYPNAEIYTLNLHGIQSTNDSNYRWKEVFFTDPTNEYSGFVYNNNINTPGQSYTIEKTLEDYRKIIREASSFYGVKCIELKDSKVNFLCKENRATLSKDGLHPNDAGGYEMAKFIINNLNIY